MRTSMKWDAEDWQAFFDERAGILQYDEGLLRERAETIAHAEVYAEKKRRRGIPLPLPTP